MSEQSRRFNFDNFNEQLSEALDENEAKMATIRPFRRPLGLGNVAIHYRAEDLTDPEPPEAA